MSSSKAQQNKPVIIKTIFVGDSGVGKTSLMEKQNDGTFRNQHITTIGCEFRCKTYKFGQISVKMQYWDTAGQQRYHSIQRSYYKNAYAVVLCFDLSRRQSFENLPKWIDQLNKYPQQYRHTFLIGCKSDLDSEIPTDQILVFAEKNKLTYFQTSSKSGEGMTQAFNKIVSVSTQSYIEKESQKITHQVQLGKQKMDQPKKKSCC